MNRTDIMTRLREMGLLRASAIVLVISNLVPLVGVLALGWSVFPVMMLYWMENVVIGIFNIPRMALCTGKGDVKPASAKFLFIPFFCLHYGMFCVVHGMFVCALFGGTTFADSQAPGLTEIWPRLIQYQLGWALLCLGMSHAVSFGVNYIWHGECRRASFGVLMFQPYVRVVALHFVLIFGGMAGLVMGSPAYALVLLVLLKIILDLRAHLAERAKLASSGGGFDMISCLVPERMRKRQ